MRHNTPNARFWHWHSPGDCWVKITLKPGQSLQHSYGGPCDEGWHRSTHQWEYDAESGVVTSTIDESGADCDGRYDSGGEWCCAVADLMAVPGVKDWDGGNVYGPPRPLWTKESSFQRDHSAEAMGY